MDRLFRTATVAAMMALMVTAFIAISPLPVNTPDLINWIRDHPFLAGMTLILLLGFIVTFVDLLRSKSIREFTETLVGVDRDGDASQHRVESRIADMLNRVEKISTYSSASLSKKVEQEIVGHYKKALSENITPEIGEEIRKLVAIQVTRETEGVAIQFLNDVHTRLRAASSTVTVRGLVNLFLGIGFAVWALFTLNSAISILTPERLNTLAMSTTLYLIATRLSLAVVVTLVAYFFLSLYKKSLDDTKFYQNEMTDISSRAVALQMAYFQGDAESRTYVLAKLMESDRNRALVGEGGAVVDDKGVADIVKALIDKLPKVGSGT